MHSPIRRDPDDIARALAQVDRSLMILKRQAKARYGPHRQDWPTDVLSELEHRKAQAIAFRQELGMRKP